MIRATVLLLGLFLLPGSMPSGAWAKDEVKAEDIGNSLKKAGNAAGDLLEKGGKAAEPEVSKAESWLDRMLFKGGKKSDKETK
jgi:hypothetical protein